MDPLQPNSTTTPTGKPEEGIVGNDILMVQVRNPETLLFSGNAVALSSVNEVGPFDVLPRHENFISLVNTKLIIFQEKHLKKEIPIEKGVMKAKANMVHIFLGVESLGEPVGAPNLSHDVEENAQKNLKKDAKEASQLQSPAK